MRHKKYIILFMVCFWFGWAMYLTATVNHHYQWFLYTFVSFGLVVFLIGFVQVLFEFINWISEKLGSLKEGKGSGD